MFHVYVEGAKDVSPGAVERLADAIAKHYGLPSADLRARLASGRFRVKGNVDRATADRYLRDLEQLGARCAIESAAPQQYQSGLSAAFSGQMPAASLGALEKSDAAFALASVDGTEDRSAPPATAFVPPPPRPRRAPSEPAIKISLPDLETPPPDLETPPPPLDPFAPPDAANDLAVDIAPDDAPPPRRASTPLPRAGTPPPFDAAMPPVASSAVLAASPRGGLFADERVRFAAGIVVAILLGFVPAHVVAGVRERSVYAAIDREVVAAQQVADSPDAYAKLDAVRAEHLQRKHDERFSIVALALVIWAAAGGAAAYGWFRKVPWDRLAIG